MLTCYATQLRTAAFDAKHAMRSGALSFRFDFDSVQFHSLDSISMRFRLRTLRFRCDAMWAFAGGARCGVGKLFMEKTGSGQLSQHIENFSESVMKIW